MFRRIAPWLRPGGLLLATLGTIKGEGVQADWLGVPMFFADATPERNRQLLAETGFVLLRDDVMARVEPEEGEVSFHWIIGRRGDVPAIKRFRGSAVVSQIGLPVLTGVAWRAGPRCADLSRLPAWRGVAPADDREAERRRDDGLVEGPQGRHHPDFDVSVGERLEQVADGLDPQRLDRTTARPVPRVLVPKLERIAGQDVPEQLGRAHRRQPGGLDRCDAARGRERQEPLTVSVGRLRRGVERDPRAVPRGK
jgi:hypothetical protein